MKQLVTYASLILLAGAVATGCGGGNDNKDLARDGVDITQFEVNEVIMTADRNYRVVGGGDTVYLDQYASIHWPKSFGGADLSVLRDTLMYYCFGDTTVKDPQEAISRFIKDTSALSDDRGGAPAYTVEAVDSLPSDYEGLGSYFNNVTAQVMEVDEEMVTYQVTSSTYYGGAHPYTAIHPFTYSFESEQVLTLDNMFTSAGRDSIMPVIVNALARQLDVPVSGLERAGIFVNQFTFPGQPYICNNILYFHYNPYDIAPYSSGMIDVAVYPGDVEGMLRPEIAKLFDVGM